MGKRRGGAVENGDQGGRFDKPMPLLRQTGTHDKRDDGRSKGGPVPTENPVAGPSFEADLRRALGVGRVAEARTLVANAEAVLVAHNTARKSGKPGLDGPVVSPPELALAKARIALATGDSVAAHAILVQSIEHYPEAAALRTLMAETMLASGRASDIRPVLQHLGRPPASLLDSPLNQVPPQAIDKKG